MQPTVRLDGFELQEGADGVFLVPVGGAGDTVLRLSPVAEYLVHHADGSRSVAELAFGAGCAPAKVWAVLDALADAGVDAQPVSPPAGDADDDRPVQLISRRRLLRTAGVAGAAIVGLNVTNSLPAAAAPRQQSPAAQEQRQKRQAAEAQRKQQRAEAQQKRQEQRQEKLAKQAPGEQQAKQNAEAREKRQAAESQQKAQRAKQRAEQRAKRQSAEAQRKQAVEQKRKQKQG